MTYEYRSDGAVPVVPGRRRSLFSCLDFLLLHCYTHYLQLSCTFNNVLDTLSLLAHLSYNLRLLSSYQKFPIGRFNSHCSSSAAFRIGQSLRWHTACMAATDDDIRNRTQQSPLASQRAKQTDHPTEANRTGRMSNFFPLGWKDGFNQWVSDTRTTNFWRQRY